MVEDDAAFGQKSGVIFALPLGCDDDAVPVQEAGEALEIAGARRMGGMVEMAHGDDIDVFLFGIWFMDWGNLRIEREEVFWGYQTVGQGPGSRQVAYHRIVTRQIDFQALVKDVPMGNQGRRWN